MSFLKKERDGKQVEQPRADIPLAPGPVDPVTSSEGAPDTINAAKKQDEHDKLKADISKELKREEQAADEADKPKRKRHPLDSLEYPRHMHKKHGEFRQVNDTEQAEQAQKDGYTLDVPQDE